MKPIHLRTTPEDNGLLETYPHYELIAFNHGLTLLKKMKINKQILWK
jgi:hypothetical protein